MAAAKLPSPFVLPLPASTAGLSELPSAVLPRVCSEAACWHFSQGTFKITRWILMSFLLWKVKGWEAWPFSTENPTWNSFLYPGWLRQKQKFSCLSLESLWQGLSFPSPSGFNWAVSPPPFCTYVGSAWEHDCLHQWGRNGGEWELMCHRLPEVSMCFCGGWGEVADTWHVLVPCLDLILKLISFDSTQQWCHVFKESSY